MAQQQKLETILFRSSCVSYFDQEWWSPSQMNNMGTKKSHSTYQQRTAKIKMMHNSGSYSSLFISKKFFVVTLCIIFSFFMLTKDPIISSVVISSNNLPFYPSYQTFWECVEKSKTVPYICMYMLKFSHMAFSNNGSMVSHFIDADVGERKPDSPRIHFSVTLNCTSPNVSYTSFLHQTYMKQKIR